MSKPKPSIGRVVHFYPDKKAVDEGAPLAAIVTRVWSDELINLAPQPDGMRAVSPFVTSVEFAEAPADFRWTWPPRV